MHKFQIALNLYEQVKEIRMKMKNPAGIAECEMNIGACYYNLEDYPKTEEHYNKAYPVYSEVGTKSELSTLLINMGTMYAVTGRHAKAKEFVERGLKLTNEISNMNELMDTYIEGAGVYAEIKDYKTAWELGRKYIHIKDSIFNITAAQTITQMQATFDLKEKENEIELLNRQKELQGEKINRQQTVLLSLSLISLLFILLIFLAYRSYTRSRAANFALSKAYTTIEEKNKAITDSLDYAKKIQTAILPLTRDLERVFPSGFGLYGPKDVVSGDFYWFAELNGKFLLAAADCTGHGVPGAFMSMLGSDKLTHAVREQKHTRPSEVLSYLNKSIRLTLKQNESGSELHDGMDIALCCFDFKTNTLEFSGANRPLYHVRDGVLKEYAGTKVPIGGFTSDTQEYTNHTIALQKDDCIYIFTDGYADQFGGPQGKKFMTRRLKELMIGASQRPMNEQEKIFLDAFNGWKGGREQVDDVLLIGVRV